MNETACIKAFIAIVEEGSQQSAAKKLNQTNAAINKKLSKLEASLNTRLLERDNRNSTLTPIGREYYLACKDAVDKLMDAEQLIKNSKIEPKGRLMVTVNRAIAEHYIIPKLKSFIEKYSLINLSLDIAERGVDYSPGKMDILISLNTLDNEDLVQKRFFTTREILCATPKYLKHASLTKISDLSALQYICHCTREPINAINIGDKIVTIDQSILRANDYGILVKAALQHIGYIYIKEFLVASELKAGKLIEILPKLNKNKINVYFYYHYQKFVDPKIRAFIDYFSI